MAIILTISLKKALIEPLCVAALMQVFYKVTVGQNADPEWEAKLESMSSKFRDLKAKALGAVKPQPAPTATLDNSHSVATAVG